MIYRLVLALNAALICMAFWGSVMNSPPNVSTPSGMWNC